jgi:hypothetical protein
MMANPDYSPELYRWQDTTVEIPPKRMENRDLGYLLEAAGDIFREVTGRNHPDDNYIGEKTDRIERLLDNPADVEILRAPLSKKDKNRVAKLKAAWSSLGGLSSRLRAVRDLNLALVDQDTNAASYLLRRFKREHERVRDEESRPARRARRPQETMYCVQEGRETPHERIAKSHHGVSQWRCTVCGEKRTRVTPSRRPAGHDVRVRQHERRVR